MSGVLVTPGVRVIALLDGSEAGDLVPKSLTRSLGGSHGDVCTVRVLRSRLLGDRVVWPPIGELRLVTERNGFRKTIFVAYGSGVTHSMKSDETEFEFRISRFHFGKPLDGVLELMPRNSETPTSIRVGEKEKIRHAKLIFNPLIDGRVRGNMLEQRGQLYFFDWESVRTATARRYQNFPFLSDKAFRDAAEKMLWTLPRAIRYLCERQNADQTVFRNPFKADYDELDASPQLLRNVGLDLGLYLNENLDRLLPPLGYTWKTEIIGDKPQIQIVKRGVGPKRSLYLQKPGVVVDADQNNIGGGNFGAGSHTTANQIRVYGGVKQYEVSIELVQGWDSEYDELTDDDTATDSDGYRDHPEYRNVHRKFVANEARDYKTAAGTLRPSVDLKAIFGHEVVPRRRRARPCLTRDVDDTPVGQSGGVLVRWKFATDAEDAPWKPIDEMDYSTYEVLEQEIGIRFSGAIVPTEVQMKSGAVRIQLTCTIEDDDRLEVLAPRTARSPQPVTVEQILDEGSRFHFRQVHKSSAHYDQVKAKTLQADEIDDAVAAMDYAVRKRDAWDMLDVNGTFELIGLEGDEELGDVISDISGRNIKLNATPGSDRDRHPQIAAISYDLIRQSRSITLETLRDANL